MLTQTELTEFIESNESFKIYLEKRGYQISSFAKGFEFFYTKLKALSDSCDVEPIQYIKVLESNYRELFDFHFAYEFMEIIKQQPNKD